VVAGGLAARIAKKAAILAGASVAAALLLGWRQVAVGVVLGAGLAQLNFYMLSRSITRALGMGQRAALYSFSQYLVRYLFTGAVLVLVGTRSVHALAGAAAGLLTVRVAIFWHVWREGLETS